MSSGIGTGHFFVGGHRHVEHAVDGRCSRDDGRGMVVDMGCPQQLAGERVERIGIRPLVSEEGGPAASVDGDTDRGSHRRFGLDLPDHAAGPGVQRIDLAIGAADEKAPRDDRRLGIGLGDASEAKRPFQLETRHVRCGELRHHCWLEAVLGGVDAPAVPTRLGKRIGRHGNRGRAGSRGACGWCRVGAEEPAHGVDLGRAEPVALSPHAAGGEHRLDRRRRQLPQCRDVRSAQCAAFMAFRAMRFKNARARRALRLFAQRRTRERREDQQVSNDSHAYSRTRCIMLVVRCRTNEMMPQPTVGVKRSE